MTNRARLWRCVGALGGTLFVFAAAFVVIVFCGLVWMEKELAGYHTDYCPPSHARHDLTTCYVLDEGGSRVLVQHSDLDDNHYYLEIRDGQSSHYFALPGSINQLAPQGYSAQLMAGETDTIKLNDSPVDLAPADASDLF